jgi:hypothetical protein
MNKIGNQQMLPQIINVALGLWLMAAPAVLRYGRPLSDSDHIAGPLAATFACIAIWEAVRGVRWINLPIGIWVAAAPWILGAPAAAQISGTLTGIAIAGLSCLGAEIEQSFAGGWAALWRTQPETHTE